MTKKLKIGLYINEASNQPIDLTHPEFGNPGVGGTQYNFITLPYYFEKFFPGQFQWIFITFGSFQLPEHFEQIIISSYQDLTEFFENRTFDYFIWKPGNSSQIVALTEKYNQPSIAWCHNIPGPNELNALAKSASIKRVVFAGHEALDVVRDHAIICKSHVIWNGFDPTPYAPDEVVEKNRALVVFLGSLTEAKCFHLLAEVWPKVIAKRPKTQLQVIGSGKLYNSELVMGKHDLAEAKYESRFLKPLSDETGNLQESIKFLGLLGREKVDILKKASVGVINPHGKSEVCPGSAIEFQACHTPVVAGARYGNLDVIKNGETGFLVKNPTQLANKILWLLEHPDQANEMGRAGSQYVTRKFDQQKIVSKWKDLILDIDEKIIPKPYPMKSNWLYNFKIGFEILRIVKFKLGLFKNLPGIYEYIETKKGNES